MNGLSPKVVEESEKGFTLLEILLTVVLLASALFPLMGLQSSSMERVSRNEKEYQAVLVARQVLSFIEAFEVQQGWKQAEMNSNQPAIEVLQTLSQQATGTPYQPPNPEILADFFVQIVAQPWAVEGLDMIAPDSLIRLQVIVSWSEAERDAIEVVYLLPLSREPVQ